MRWWVYYSRGGCNTGDHSWGLEGFGTEGEARAFVEEGKKVEPEMSWAIVRGEVVGEG